MRYQSLLLALSAAVVMSAGAQTARPSRADLLVTPAWLAAHVNDANLVVLHVGMDSRAEYAKAHIPGARYLELDDIAVSSMNHTDSLMLELPSAEQLRAQLAALGISDNSRVIVSFDGDDISPSTRVMLTLDYAGLGARSSLLDGGTAAWTASGRSLTAQPSKPVVAGKLSALRIKPVVTNVAYVRTHLADMGFHLIDGRTGVYYDGIKQGMKPGRTGHIAGAHSLPYTDVTDDKLRFKSPEQLAALFAKAGVGPRDTVVAYCHIGEQATAVLFAARTLGHPVLLYDGSFQEWGRRTDLPVEVSSDLSRKRF